MANEFQVGQKYRVVTVEPHPAVAMVKGETIVITGVETVTEVSYNYVGDYEGGRSLQRRADSPAMQALELVAPFEVGKLYRRVDDKWPYGLWRVSQTGEDARGIKWVIVIGNISGKPHFIMEEEFHLWKLDEVG